ncbi:MAG: DUF5683 domain-containing protein [Bacteroidota bacterium]
MKKIVFLVFWVTLVLTTQAQETTVLKDTVVLDDFEDAQLFTEVSQLDPQRAALLSAILPGLGQAYNKQYWKVPIVLSGMIVFGHFIDYNNRIYNGFRNAVVTEQSQGINPYSSLISSRDGLVRNRDLFRRNRDFLMILGSVFYILNIVDAHVSAHLDEFNVNDDLALGIKPTIQQTPLFSRAMGVSFVLSF